ncbi:MAG TPA: PAS domain-containing sensor histidine kinase [Rhizomicrobium sp.]|nr:PAS domain-containing sensor histidine kinase [Rhizomicrobium sp.]
MAAWGEAESPGSRSDLATRSVRINFALALLAAGAGAVFGFGLAPGRDPEISIGAALFMALGLLLAVARWANAAVARPLTAAELGRSAFFEHAIEGIFRTSVSGRYLDANPALARIYGYSDVPALMEGLTNIAGQLYLDASRREAFQALLRENDSVVDFVSEIRRRDGSTIWISENARAVRNWTGQIIFYEGTVEDVTAKIEAQQAMRRALRQMEEAARSKSAFLAAMSHELKTPLNAVLGFSEILKGELLGPLGQPVYRDYASDIHASGARLLAVINDILDSARMQAGSMHLDRRAVALADIVHDALVGARQAANDDRLVGVELPDTLPLLFVDPQRLCQALGKLLSNAFKFTPGHGAIRLSAGRTENGGVTISVIDEGIGMEPEKIALALEPFGQVDRSLARRFEGAGLGLSIARALVELHGGSLALASEKGSGTTVTIALPPNAVSEHTKKTALACAAVSA